MTILFTDNNKPDRGSTASTKGRSLNQIGSEVPGLEPHDGRSQTYNSEFNRPGTIFDGEPAIGQARSIVLRVREKKIYPRDGFGQLIGLIHANRAHHELHQNLVAFLCSYLARNPSVYQSEYCIRQTRQLVEGLTDIAEPTTRALCQAASFLKIKSPTLTHIILDKVLADHPDCEVAYSIRSDLHLIRGEFDAAMHATTKLLNLNPQCTIGLNTKGRIHLALKNYDAAHDCLDHSLHINGRDELSMTLKGQTYLEQGQHRKAHSCFDAVLYLNPSNAITLGLKAETHIAEKKYAEAHQCLDAALGVAPREPTLHNIKGRAYFLEGKYVEAKRVFEACLRLHRYNDTARRWLRGTEIRLAEIHQVVSRI
jgi:tetratricopeptide (TPR) repeat protein